MGVIVAQGFAIKAILPLKERIPYFVETSSSGAVSVSQKVGQEFKPEQNNIRYFINMWVRDSFSVDSRLTTELYFPEAYSMSRGNAIQEMRDYIIKNKIIEGITTNPNWKREPKISTVSFIADGVVLVRYSIYEIGQTSADNGKKLAITIHYTLIPPTTEEEINHNPIGFFVTDFTINEEF